MWKAHVSVNGAYRLGTSIGRISLGKIGIFE